MPSLLRRREQARPATPGASRRERRDVFVSYAREDVDFVRRLHDGLVGAGKKLYVDFSDIPDWSEDWQRDLYSEIDASDTVVVVLSPDSIGSPNVSREVDRAVAQNKRLKPLLYRDVADGAVPAELSRPQWIDFRDSTRFDPQLRELLAVLATDVNWIQRHTRFLLAANEWETRGEDRSLLLGRSDLRDAEAWLAGQAGKEPPPSPLQVRYILASRSAAARRQRITMGSVAAALAVTAGLAIFALIQRGQAISQRDQARSRELAALSTAQLATDPERSLRLALRSAESARTGQAEAALQQALAQSRVRMALHTRSRSRILDSAVTPDGRFAVTAHSDGLGRVWDLRSGRQVATLRGHRNAVSSVEISPDGRRAVTASTPTSPEHPDGSARIWDLPSGRLVETLVNDATGIGTAVFSPDGRRVLTTTDVDSLDPAAIWDARTGRRLLQIGKPGETDFGTWAPDGRRIATIDSGGVNVWDARTGTRVRAFRTLVSKDQFASDLAFSPDGRRLAAAGDGVGWIAAIETGRLTTLPGRHDLFNALRSIHFCPDGTCVLTTSDDDTARLWSLTGRTLATLRGHTANVTDAGFSPDGRYVLTQSEDGTARVWSARSGAELAVLRGHTGEITGAHFLPGGNRVLTTSVDGTGRVWDPGVAVLQDQSGLADASVSPNEKQVATGSSDGVARLWTADGRLERTLKSDDLSSVQAITFTPDGSRILTEQDTVLLWTQEGKLVRRLENPDGSNISYPAFSLDSSRLGTGGDDAVLLFDAKDGRRLATLPVGSASDRKTAVFRPDFSRDGKLVAAPGALTGAHIWHVRGSTRSLDLLTRERIDKVAFSPDGKQLATAGDSAKVERLWDLATKKSVVLDRYPTGVRDVEFSPDGRLIASVSAGERVVRVHDAQTGKLVSTLRHENEVLKASFDPRSRLVLTVSDEDTAHLWDARSGRLVTSLAGHSDTISAAHFSPDGRRIVTASDDKTVLVQQCDECRPYDQLLELARKRVTPLSAGE